MNSIAFLGISPNMRTSASFFAYLYAGFLSGQSFVRYCPTHCAYINFGAEAACHLGAIA